jgi:hypothetical protein
VRHMRKAEGLYQDGDGEPQLHRQQL